jgi:hypothetical protein
MSETVITDRAEAMFLAPDEHDEERHTAVPISRSPAASPDHSGTKVVCAWCGVFTAPGSGCDACGSPLS